MVFGGRRMGHPVRPARRGVQPVAGCPAALREGRGTVASRLLKRAAADAREHVPLSQEIARTATHGAGYGVRGGRPIRR